MDNSVYNSYEDILNEYMDVWEKYGCPMNGVSRAQVRLLFKQGEYDEAMEIIDKHHRKMVKTGKMPDIRRVSVDVNLPLSQKVDDVRFGVSEEWLDDSEECEHWQHGEDNEWNEYAGDGFHRKSKLKNGW